MTVLASPVTMSDGYLATGSLIESLIHVSKDVCSADSLSKVNVRNVSTMIRRVKLLSSLFEEVRETNLSLPPSTILCLTELFSMIRRAKLLIQLCSEGSSLWGLIQTEFVSSQFYVLVKEMGSALDILPLSLLGVSSDTHEQVALLHKQAKRTEIHIDMKEIEKREELLQLLGVSKANSVKIMKRVKEIFNSIGLKTRVDYEEEVSKLEAEVKKQAGTGGLIVVSNINNLICFVNYCKSVVFITNQSEKMKDELTDKKLTSNSSSSNKNGDQFSASVSVNIPDEFRCPISLDRMRDPVIVASGHTYDRKSIAKWINSGHHTCPKSGQRLIHLALIPNYALKSLMEHWTHKNVPASSVETKVHESQPVDHISAVKTAADAVKMTAEFLVGKLATGSPEIQRQAAYELRLLAKTGMGNRRIISEAGAIPFLVTLLNSPDPGIQENCVTALLNLSIFDNNKILIMAAGAIDHIVNVLESGRTMEARENAAAAIFSLSMIDECKVAIGARPRSIPGLVGLLRDGSPAGKKDAATALLNLSGYKSNKVSVVSAGAVPVLVGMLSDERASITDDALAVLATLLGCGDGVEEIRKSRALLPLLVDLLRLGSAKGRENSITLLLGICKDGGDEVARRLLVNPRSVPALQSLVAEGSLRARRKADALLRLLNRCCLQHNSRA